MTRAHTLSPEQFDQLAAGRPSRAAAASVFNAHHDRLHLLTRVVLENRVNSNPALSEAVATLSQAQSGAPAICAQVLQDGWFGSWVTRCLQRSADPAPHLPRLGNLAAAASWRAGMDASVNVAVEDGRVHLPTMGAAVVGNTAGPARLEIRNRRFLVHVAGRPTVRVHPMAGDPGWLALRRLHLEPTGAAPTLTIDDLDPLRDCYASPPSGRLTSAEHAAWSTRGQEAWALIARYAAGPGARIVGWTRTLVPLASTTEDANLSISSRDALRSVAMSLPPSPIDFAVALVHEHAHAVLNGLLLFTRVARQDASKRYFAPWRSDARPAVGTVHGIFAFLAVAELWALLLSAPTVRAQAQEQLAQRRLELRSAVDQVRAGGELTGAGARLLDHCWQRLERLEREPLNAVVQRRAERALADRRAAWESHNANLKP